MRRLALNSRERRRHPRRPAIARGIPAGSCPSRSLFVFSPWWGGLAVSLRPSWPRTRHLRGPTVPPPRVCVKENRCQTSSSQWARRPQPANPFASASALQLPGSLRRFPVDAAPQGWVSFSHGQATQDLWAVKARGCSTQGLDTAAGPLFCSPPQSATRESLSLKKAPREKPGAEKT